MKINRVAVGVIVGVVVIAAVATVTWLSVSDSAEASDRGTCANATYSLEAEREDDTLEVSFELQSSAPGETWQIKIAQADEVLLEDERETDADAEIDVDVYAPRTGDNRFTATATQGDDVCSAAITAG